MAGKHPHPKATPSKAAFDKDFQNKLRLNAEFKDFQKAFVKTAKAFPEVKKLVIPLKRLERAVIRAAHGVKFVFKGKEQRA